MGWKSLGSVSFWEKSDWEKRFAIGRSRVLSRRDKTHRRIGSADRWLLVGEVLLDVRVAFVDKRHFGLRYVVTGEEETVGGDNTEVKAEVFMRPVDP